MVDQMLNSTSGDYHHLSTNYNTGMELKHIVMVTQLKTWLFLDTDSRQANCNHELSSLGVNLVKICR
jgi:hypothetical protein